MPINWAEVDDDGGTKPRPAKSSGSRKPPSLVEQVGETVAAIPPGLLGLAKASAGEVGASVRGAVQPGWATRKKGETREQFQARTHPLINQFLDSFAATGRRTSEFAGALAPGGKKPSETEYAKASQEGRIVATLLEDVANVTPAGRVAGAAGRQAATKAAGAGMPRLAAAARAAAAAAEAPSAAGVAARKAGGSAIRRAGKAAAESETIGGLLRIANLDPDSRLLRKEALDSGYEKFAAGLGAAVTRGEELQRILPDLDEQRAATLVGEGEAKALAELRRNRPDDFEPYVKRTFGETVPTKAAHLAADFVDGKDPALVSRVSRFLEVGRESAGGRRARSEAYYRSGVPGRAEQAGFDPLSLSVERQVAKVKANAQRARKVADEMAGRAETAMLRKELIEDHVNPDAPPLRRPVAPEAEGPGEILRFDPDAKPPSLARTINRTGENVFPLRKAVATNNRVQRLAVEADRANQLAKRAESVAQRYERRLAKVEAQARDSLTNAPSRLRPVLQRNREVSSLLVEQANRLRRDGLELDAKRVERALDEIPTTLERLRDAGVDAEYFPHLRPKAKESRAGVDHTSLPVQRKGREERLRKGSPEYERTVRSQTQAEVDDIKNAIAIETAERIRSLPFVRRFSSVEEAKLSGYVAWDPKNPFGQGAQITSSTTFIPEHIYEGFRRQFTDGKMEKILRRTYDPAIQAFKIAVLPLSISWQVGNLAGNALLATIAGGVTPVQLVKSINEAVRLYRQSGPRGQRTWEAVTDRRLFTAGPTYEEMRFLREPADALLGDGRLGSAVRTAGKPLGALVRKSYNLNAFVDNVGRSGVYLAKRSKGASHEMALKTALQAMGDFTRMTPWERKVARRIIPFYAWQRHLTQLAVRLPIEHPMRTAWTLHLADMFTDKELSDELLDYMKGAVPFGDKLVGTGGLNPYSRVGGLLLPDNFRRSLSPVIKLALENAPGSPAKGINLFTGKPYTRPAGTAKQDEFGRDLPTAPSVARQISQISPQWRLIEALNGRNEVVRYETGDPVLAKGRPIPTTDRGPLGSALRFLGFPITSRDAALAMAKRTRQRQEEARKAKERYDRRLARARLR